MLRSIKAESTENDGRLIQIPYLGKAFLIRTEWSTDQNRVTENHLDICVKTGILSGKIKYRVCAYDVEGVTRRVMWWEDIKE